MSKRGSRSWVRSVYQRMKFSQRTATTSRPTVTRSLWEEIKTQYLHDLATAVRTYKIPDELVLNADQAPSKYVSASNVTMAEQGGKHISMQVEMINVLSHLQLFKV